MKLEQHKNVFYKNIGTYMALINNELKKEYPLEPLSNHIKMVGGYAFKSSHYLSEGIPVIRISDFQNEKIELTGVKYYEESDDLERYELIAGDVIIAMTGGTIGKLAIVQEGLGKLYLNQRVGKFQVLNSNEFEDEYVYWLARGIQDIVQNLGYGGAQPNVSNKQVEALEFAFPERKIQRQIIAFLNDIKGNKMNGPYFNANVENKIKNLQTTSVKLSTIKNDAVLNESFIAKLKKSILQEAVQGKLTADWRINNTNIEDASILLKRILEEKAQLIKAKKIKKEKPLTPIIKDEMPYDLPEGWVWCRFGNLITFLNGYAFKSSTYVPTSEYQIIRLGNVKNDNFIINTKEAYVPSSVGEVTLDYQLFENDILTTLTGTKNRRDYCFTCLVKPEHLEQKVLLLNQRVGCIRAIDKSASELFNKFLKSDIILNQLFETETGTANQGNIGSTAFKNLVFPFPPLEEQKAIVQKVNALMGLCDTLEQQVQQSQEQSEKLIQSVMRESLEVNTTF